MTNQSDIFDWFNGIILIKKNKKVVYIKDIKTDSVSYNHYMKNNYENFENVFMLLDNNKFNFDYILHKYLTKIANKVI
jgi:hypothetical protein